MAIKQAVIRRKPVEPEPEEFEDEVEEVEEVEEEEAPAPKKRIVPPAPVMRKVAPVAKKRPVVEEEEEELVEEEEVEPEPKKRVVPPAKTTDVKVKSVSTTVVDSLLPGLLEGIENGKAIIITRLGDDKWQVAAANAVVSGVKMSPKEYEQTVHTEEYLAWYDEWKVKTNAEKVAFAKQNKIQYPKHDDPRVEAIGLAEAVMEHLGIDKYKPGYERPSVRRALRGK